LRSLSSSTVSGIEEDWLASVKFHGKSVKVRLTEVYPNDNADSVPAKKRVPKGSFAFTTGKPISGEPKAIEIRLITPGSQPILLPLQCLAPAKPRRAEGRAMVIAGNLFGKEVMVIGVDEGGIDWDLLLLDGSRLIVTVSPDHLVELRPHPS
jgi:hypothetical protein